VELISFVIDEWAAGAAVLHQVYSMLENPTRIESKGVSRHGTIFWSE